GEAVRFGPLGLYSALVLFTPPFLLGPAPMSDTTHTIPLFQSVRMAHERPPRTPKEAVPFPRHMTTPPQGREESCRYDNRRGSVSPQNLSLRSGCSSLLSERPLLLICRLSPCPV